VAHRKGFSLIETLMAIAVVSLVALIGYPKAINAIATTNVRSARTAVVNMIATARAVATQTNRQGAKVEFVGNKVMVTATPRRKTTGSGNKDTVGTVQDLNKAYGVTVDASQAPTIAFDPRGIGSGFNSQSGSTITLTKSGKTQTIKVDMLGRVGK
jgi:prepilin-type N-terminal cleavage/methylation domain-containing protein